MLIARLIIFFDKLAMFNLNVHVTASMNDLCDKVIMGKWFVQTDILLSILQKYITDVNFLWRHFAVEQSTSKWAHTYPKSICSKWI